MRKSYSKIRHIQESNTLLENRRRTIMEQVPPAPAPAATPPTPAPAPVPATPPATAPVPGPNPPAPVSQEVADCTPGVTGSLDANGMLTKPDGTKCKVVCLSGTPPTAG
jgi:hypothetical protein